MMSIEQISQTIMSQSKEIKQIQEETNIYTETRE